MSLLDRLLRADGPILIHDLGELKRVAAALQVLRDRGCILDEHPQRGVRLVRTDLACWADYIEHRHSRGLGRRVSVYRETTSTQDVARQVVAAQGSAAIGEVIVADAQTAGRGRMGRRWFAPAGGGLLLTAIVSLEGSGPERLTLGSCCALADVVEAASEATARIRWPNDVLIDGAKVGGILVESVGGLGLIGIGLNVRLDPGDLPEHDGDIPLQATSLDDHGGVLDRLALLDRLLDRLEFCLEQATDQELHDAWRERSCLMQQRVTVLSAGRELRGRVIDLDPRHGLMLEVDQGTVTVLPAATTSLLDASK
ncbi:MAG: biotin--[acetyl-CoA-carboxylase] ligase [Phycisphaerae bacterium]|nr:biotin--[acetyl-CoA-carboxylase] ligase [Phycisphaerae bacterium]